LSIRACSAVNGTIQQPIRLRPRRQRPSRRAAEERFLRKAGKDRINIATGAGVKDVHLLANGRNRSQGI
jgi:hypothetical protein